MNREIIGFSLKDVQLIHHLLLIILLLGCWLFFRPEVQIPLDAGGEDIEGYKTPQAQTDSIKIPGLMSSYTLTEDNKELYLINPDGNTVYFKYSITEDDEQIYETDYIEPNKMERADLWGILDSGEHTLKVSISTIDIDTRESCNSAALETKVIIK